MPHLLLGAVGWRRGIRHDRTVVRLPTAIRATPAEPGAKEPHEHVQHNLTGPLRNVYD